jgi:hypothetical protein
MQSIPIYDTIEGLTILKDDDDISSFYYLPRTLQIARGGPDNRPMFTFLKYQLPVEREGEDDKGGGYLVFTTQLVEDSKFLDTKVKPILQSRMRAAYPNEPNLPPPNLKAIDFTGGEVRLLIMKDNRFVSEVQSGKPSLFGNNTASFAVELKDLGAQLFYDALKKGAGIAVVEYDLVFDTRLPAVHVHAHADSDEVKHVTMGYTTERVTNEDTWGNEESHDVAHRTSISETMDSMGLIQLTIDKGSSGIKDEDVEALRAFAFSKLDDWVKENFLKGGSIATAEDKKSQWMKFIDEDIHKVFDLDLVQRDVIQRQYNPSARFDPGFLGDDIDKLVLEIDLGTAEWYFNTLNVNVDTNLDFDMYGDIVHSVVGHFSYTGEKDGQRIDKRESFAFTKDDRDPKKFTTRLAKVGQDKYHVQVEVNYKSGPVTSAILYEEDTTLRDYTLRVPNPGVMALHVAATDVQAFDTQKLTSIEVEIGYADPARKVPDVVEKVILTKEHYEIDYKRVIYAPWDKPYRYRTTYVINDDAGPQRITTEWVDGGHDPGATKAYLSIGTPFDNLFHLSVLPSVDWDEVQTLIVDLEYLDSGHDYQQRRTLSLSQTSLTSLQQPLWKFPLRDPDVRGYRYSVKTLGKDGTVKSKDWTDVPSDAGTLVVGDAVGGVVKLQVDPGDTGVGTDLRRVVVRLRYEDKAHSVLDEQALVFRDATPQTWSIARADATVSEYTYDVDYVRNDGSVTSLTGQKGRISGASEFLFLPKAPAPEPTPAPAGGPGTVPGPGTVTPPVGGTGTGTPVVDPAQPQPQPTPAGPGPVPAPGPNA